MKKTLSFAEIYHLSRQLDQTLMGAQLQNIWTSDEIIVFDFYLQDNIFLIFRVNQIGPGFWITQKLPKFSKKQLPIGLFLNAHAKNLRWRNSVVTAERGRVLTIHLGNSSRVVKMDFLLVPRSVNLSVFVDPDDKQIHLRKPRELPASTIQDVQPSDINLQDLESLLNPVVVDHQSKNPVASVVSEEQKQKWLQKKQQALDSLEQQAQKPEYLMWQNFGLAVKSGLNKIDSGSDSSWSAEIVQEYSGVYPLLTKVDEIFSKAKLLKQKHLGQLERIQKLKKEIEVGYPEKSAGAAKPQLLKKAEARGRQFESHGFMAVIGKSAADNLNILRKARPHDLWVHLKDYPGSYGVISVNKNQNVPEAVLHEVSAWVAQSSMGKKFDLIDKLEVLVCECRHVKPIKGDKLGRVTYHDARHLLWRRT